MIGYAGVLPPFTAWLCQCACGQKFIATSANLNRGDRGCGCRRQKHGRSKSRLYRLWRQLESRCHDPLDKSYAQYGGRGIDLDAPWRRSFEKFAADVGEPPGKRHVLERIDKQRGYYPGNCRWATRSQASKNRALVIEHAGQRLTTRQWERRLGLSQQALSRRIALCRRLGADLAEAVSTPRGRQLPCVTRRRRDQKQRTASGRDNND